MKKLLLVATMFGAGMTFSHAGINIRIGLPLPPLPPLPGIVIRQPAVVCPPPPVVIVPPVCPPRIVVPCPPPPCEPRRVYWHGNRHDDYNRGRRHHR